MGYMGFGMRKEDYTRKPKKAFKKYKEHFETNRALQDDVENYWNTNEKISRYKQLKETLGFRIFIALILVVAFGYIIWIFLIREPLSQILQ
jgi:nitrate reductase NapE component